MNFQFDQISDSEFHRRYKFSRITPHERSMWSGSDNEDEWNINQNDSSLRARLDACGWRIDSIEYRYNNYGFRSDDDWDICHKGKGAMFLGCSITEGIGLNIEQTWGYRMSKILGGKFYNLGQSGTGIETQYRFMRAWAPELMPTAILTIGAIGPRREILHDDRAPSTVSAWTIKDTATTTEIGLISEADHLLSTQRALDAMKHIATRLCIPLYVPSIETGDRARRRALQSGEIARDGMHPGVGYHEELSRGLQDWQRIA